MSVGNPNSPPAVNSTLILVLGILSVVGLSFLGPVAWIMGNQAMRVLNNVAADPAQRTNVKIGWICGIIGTVILIATIIYLCVVMFVVKTVMNPVLNQMQNVSEQGDTEPAISPSSSKIRTSKSSSDSFDAAIISDDTAKIKSMLAKNPALANQKGPTGETPLFNAAFFGHKEVVSLLIAHGAKVNAKDDFGHTALDKAQARGKEDIVALLKSHGAVSGKK